MAGGTPTTPKLSAKGRQAREAQRAREAEALRENLHKRKAQARARDGATEVGPGGGLGAKDPNTEDGGGRA